MKKDEALEAEIVNEIVLSEIKYLVSTTDLKALLEEYSDIPTINPDADEDLVGKQYQFVLKGHKAFVKARTGIEKTRKTLKQPALEYGEKVDEIAKEFQSLIKTTEIQLFTQRKLVENNEDRKQREAEEAEELRIDTIKHKMKAFEMLPLVWINNTSDEILAMLNDSINPTEEIFEEFFNEAVTVFTNSHAQLIKMYDDKILVENAQKIQDERDAETARLKEIEDKRLRDERDVLAKEQAEFQRQKDAFDRQQREQQEAIDRQNAERVADELQAKQKQDKKIAQDKIKNLEFPKEIYIVVGYEIINDEPSPIAYESTNFTLDSAKQFQNRVNKNSKIFKAVELI